MHVVDVPPFSWPFMSCMHEINWKELKIRRKVEGEGQGSLVGHGGDGSFATDPARGEAVCSKSECGTAFSCQVACGRSLRWRCVDPVAPVLP